MWTQWPVAARLPQTTHTHVVTPALRGGSHLDQHFSLDSTLEPGSSHPQCAGCVSPSSDPTPSPVPSRGGSLRPFSIGVGGGQVGQGCATPSCLARAKTCTLACPPGTLSHRDATALGTDCRSLFSKREVLLPRELLTPSGE